MNNKSDVQVVPILTDGIADVEDNDGNNKIQISVAKLRMSQESPAADKNNIERLQQSDGKVITFESNEFNSMQSSPSPLKKANNTSHKKSQRALENVEEEKHEEY